MCSRNSTACRYIDIFKRAINSTISRAASWIFWPLNKRPQGRNGTRERPTPCGKTCATSSSAHSIITWFKRRSALPHGFSPAVASAHSLWRRHHTGNQTGPSTSDFRIRHYGKRSRSPNYALRRETDQGGCTSRDENQPGIAGRDRVERRRGVVSGFNGNLRLQSKGAHRVFGK